MIRPSVAQELNAMGDKSPKNTDKAKKQKKAKKAAAAPQKA
jgi:hypothetical protein